MPVVVASSTRSADALISYALDDKPGQQGERYVMASGVGGLLVSVAKQQMRDVRKKWGKDKPGAFVQAYHVIQSFAKDELDPEDPDSWMTAQQLGIALAEDRFPGRQVLVVTQRDGSTGCVHNHLVANSIATTTGRSLNSSIVTHARLVEAHEEVLEGQGFAQRADLKQAFSDASERFERGEPSGLRRAGSTSNSELREFHRHIIWESEYELADEFGGPREKQPFSLTVLKHDIERTLADPAVVDWDSLVEVGRSCGVQIEKRGKKGRGISYGMLREEPDGSFAEPKASDRRRCTTLGAEFEMDAIEAAFARNREISAATHQQAQNQQLLTATDRMRIALNEAAAEADKLSRGLIESHLAERAHDDVARRNQSQELDVHPIGVTLPAAQQADARLEAFADATTRRTMDEGKRADNSLQPRTLTPVPVVEERAAIAPRPRATSARFPELLNSEERTVQKDREHLPGD